WCGYACPQTVWTEVFLWIERFCEGRRNQRIKLDGGKWTREKILRKSAKQFLWITLSLWTGFTFVGFFTPILDLGHAAASLSFSGWEGFWVVFYGFETYGNAGYMREQVCKYMCPYARFQSAMFDHDTLIISYDEARGEPRGHRKRGVPSVLALAGKHESEIGNRQDANLASPSTASRSEATRDMPPPAALPDSRFPIAHSQPLGDCIACDACVQVCPTGIDIRDGLQIECIACAACIDACDSVMDKMAYPRGLIRYTTQNALERKPTRIVRARTIVYAVILGGLTVAFGVGLARRTPVDVDVIRDRNALYRLLDDGRVENVYSVKILNKTERAHRFVVTVGGVGELTLAPVPAQFDVDSGEVFSATVRVRRPAY